MSASSSDVKAVNPQSKRRRNPSPRGTAGQAMRDDPSTTIRPGMSSGASSSHLGTTPKSGMPRNVTPTSRMPGMSSGPSTGVLSDPLPPQNDYPTAEGYDTWWISEYVTETSW